MNTDLIPWLAFIGFLLIGNLLGAFIFVCGTLAGNRKALPPALISLSCAVGCAVMIALIVVYG